MISKSLLCLQLTREVPPGYGGVERLVHILGNALPSTVFSLRSHTATQDPLPVDYKRVYLPSISLGRLFIPLPSLHIFYLLFSSTPLIAHLPCPTVLLITSLAKFLKPKRKIVIFWHAFLQPHQGILGFCEYLYQELALAVSRCCYVITTSPILRHSLLSRGCHSRLVHVLPCALSPQVESDLKHLRRSRSNVCTSGRVIFIGRLNSYKRVDWLVRAISNAPAVRELHILGDGPCLSALKKLVNSTIAEPQRVFFHGTVSEHEKARLLSICDVLVLPSDRCNEAFGIAQLEAMAAGLPSLAFNVADSGMHWVSQLNSLKWSGSPSDLSIVLQRIFTDPPLLNQLSLEACHRYDSFYSYCEWFRSLRSLQMLLRL